MFFGCRRCARATPDAPARLPDGRGALVPPDTSRAARDPQAIVWRTKQNTPGDNDMARARPTGVHKRARRPPTPACSPSRRTHRGLKRECRAASANVWSPQARTGNIDICIYIYICLMRMQGHAERMARDAAARAKGGWPRARTMHVQPACMRHVPQDARRATRHPANQPPSIAQYDGPVGLLGARRS